MGVGESSDESSDVDDITKCGGLNQSGLWMKYDMG